MGSKSTPSQEPIQISSQTINPITYDDSLSILENIKPLPQEYIWALKHVDFEGNEKTFWNISSKGNLELLQTVHFILKSKLQQPL